MDVCDPNIKYEDLKERVERDVGRPLNISRKQICNLYATIQQDKLLLPPMVLSKSRTYITDRKSPFTQADYERLFQSTTLKAQLKRLASKIGALVDKGSTKEQLRDGIFARLRTMGVREPIKLGTTTTKVRRVSAPLNVSVNNNRNVSVNNNRNVSVNNNRNVPTNVPTNNNRNVSMNNNRNVSMNNNRNVSTNNNRNVSTNNNRNVSTNVRTNNSVVNKKSAVFKPGFIPNFIRKRQVEENVSAAPVVERVARQNNTEGARPVVRAIQPPMALARPSVPRNFAPSIRPVNNRRDLEKIDLRKKLQRELNMLTNLSQEDVNTYVQNLQSNRASLKNITSRAKRQNEIYKQKKEQIKKKLEDVKNQMTITAKNIYKARLNAIPRGRGQSYLNNIERDLLKDIQTADEIRKRSTLRKELMANNGTELDAKYKSLYNKYTSNKNREMLNKVYNGMKNKRPRINTAADELTMKEVVQMLNKNKARREQTEVTNTIARLLTEYNRKTRANAAQSELNSIQKQLANKQQERVKILQNQLTQLQNISRRTNNPEVLEQVETTEQELSAAKNATVRQEQEVEQIKSRRKRRRTNDMNSANEGNSNTRRFNANAAAAAAAAANARAKANANARAKANANARAKANANARAKANANAQAKANANAQAKANANARAKANANARAKANANARAKANANAARARNAELKRAAEEEKRLAMEVEREVRTEADREERERKKLELEEKRKEMNRIRQENAAARAEEKSIKQKEKRAAEQEALKKRDMARRYGVNTGYVNAFMNATPNADLKAKVNADKRVARLFGTRTKYIDENVYNSTLEQAQEYYKDKMDKQKLANLAFKAKVSTSYVRNYMNARNQTIANVNQGAFLNKVRKDVALANIESKAQGRGRLRTLVNRARLSYVAENEYNERMNKAKTSKGGLNLKKGLKKFANVSDSYLEQYMNANPVGNAENMNAYQKKLKEKADKDRAIVRQEGGLKRLGGLKYIPESQYKQRKNALNKKNTGIPTSFVNAYLQEKNQTMDTLNREGLKAKFQKSKLLADLTNEQLTYERDDAKLNAMLKNAQNIDTIAKNAKTTRAYVKQYISKKNMSVANFKNSPQKVDELKKLLELERYGVTPQFRDAHLLALNKTNVTQINIEALKNKFNKTKKLGKPNTPYMSNEELRVALSNMESAKLNKAREPAERRELKTRAKLLGITTNQLMAKYKLGNSNRLNLEKLQKNMNVAQVKKLAGARANLFLTPNGNAIRSNYQKNNGSANINTIKRTLLATKKMEKNIKKSTKEQQKLKKTEVGEYMKKYGVSANIVRNATNDEGRVNVNQILLKKYGANSKYLEEFKAARPRNALSESKLKRDQAYAQLLQTNMRFVPRSEFGNVQRKMGNAKREMYSKKYGTTNNVTADVVARVLRQLPGKAIESDLFTKPETEKAVLNAFEKLKKDTSTIQKMKHLSNASKKSFIERLEKGENVLTYAAQSDKAAKGKTKANNTTTNNLTKFTRVAELTPEKRTNTEKALRAMNIPPKNIARLMKRLNKGENVMNEARQIQQSAKATKNATLQALKNEVMRAYKNPNIVEKIRNATTMEEVRRLKQNNPSTVSKIKALKHLSMIKKRQYVKQLESAANFKEVLAQAMREDAVLGFSKKEKNKNKVNSVRNAIGKLAYGANFEQRLANITQSAPQAPKRGILNRFRDASGKNTKKQETKNATVVPELTRKNIKNARAAAKEATNTNTFVNAPETFNSAAPAAPKRGGGIFSRFRGNGNTNTFVNAPETFNSAASAAPKRGGGIFSRFRGNTKAKAVPELTRKNIKNAAKEATKAKAVPELTKSLTRKNIKNVAKEATKVAVPELTKSSTRKNIKNAAREATKVAVPELTKSLTRKNIKNEAAAAKAAKPQNTKPAAAPVAKPQNTKPAAPVAKQPAAAPVAKQPAAAPVAKQPVPELTKSSTRKNIKNEAAAAKAAKQPVAAPVAKQPVVPVKRGPQIRVLPIPKAPQNAPKRRSAAAAAGAVTKQMIAGSFNFSGVPVKNRIRAFEKKTS